MVKWMDVPGSDRVTSDVGVSSTLQVCHCQKALSEVTSSVNLKGSLLAELGKTNEAVAKYQEHRFL